MSFPQPIGSAFSATAREEKQVESLPRLAEYYLPIDFLRDFNVVDTPGTNTMVSEHQTITENFVPRADLILFVFSVVNPWTQSAWDFLKFVQKKWLKNVVFVLQQSDLRDAREVEVIRRHLEETAMERLRRITLPVFRSLGAQSAAGPNRPGWTRTGSGTKASSLALEEQINLIVSELGASMLKLRSACQTGQLMIKEIATSLTNRSKSSGAMKPGSLGSDQFVQARKEQTLSARLQGCFAESSGPAANARRGKPLLERRSLSGELGN